MDTKPIWRAPLLLALANLSLLTFGGCAIVDQYGARAIEYNEQTAASKSSIILLNILRAAYREPLQFTDVTTVTGTASVQGGLNATIPLRIGGTAFSTPQILELNPSASVSGGPNFSIANLNTQEFYQGLQAPISPQVIANYAAAGVSLNVLLPLLISDITLEEHDQIRVLRNTGSSPESFRGFRHVTKELVRQGLTVSVRENEAESIGPVLTKKEARDPKLLAGLAQAMTSGDSPLSLQGIKLANGTTSDSEFRFGKSAEKKATLCFKNKVIPREDLDPDFEVSKKLQAIHPVYLNFEPFPPILIPRAMYCDQAKQADQNSAAKPPEERKSSLTPRSVEQIFLFLGELVRTELGLNDNLPKDLQDSGHFTDAHIPLYLFKFEQRMPVNGEISANFHGTTYTVAADPSGADASSQVLALLTDLLALQSSAKSLPPPNVIAIAP